MEKTIYFIRHGYALHNKLFWDIGKRAYSEYRDTPLLEEGYNQAKRLNSIWKELNNIQLVVVSPCTRTLHTAEFVFKNQNIPMIAKDFLIEYPIGGHEICNHRYDLDHLKHLYPYIDFNNNPQSLIWPDRVESIRNLNDRIETMFDWIGQRRETTIAIVSHSSFIGQMKDKKIGDESNELKHCHPYKIIVNYSHKKKFISMREIKE